MGTTRPAFQSSTLFTVTALTISLTVANIFAAPTLKPRVIFPKPATTTIDADHQDPSEIVVKFHEGTRVRLRGGRLELDAESLTEQDRLRLRRNGLSDQQVLGDVERANQILFSLRDGSLVRMFAREETVLDRERAELEPRAGEELADLNLYYMLVLRSANVAQSAALIDALNELESVEISYAEPRPEVAAADIPPLTDFNLTETEGYLRRAGLRGIDADWARRLPGGGGAGMRVEDVELGWITDHEDLPGTYFAQNGWNVAERDHGTEVLGVMAAADNDYGTIGITPDVALGISSPVWAKWNTPHDTAAAIDNAAAALNFGDVLVIELAYYAGTPPGVSCDRNCGNGNCDQFAHVPMENVQANYDAVRHATAKGIIVVAAAGNGQVSLDNAFYGGRFNRFVRDSGAILVGANDGRSLNAACWSNYGSRVDLQGWGASVATLGASRNGGNRNPDPHDDPRQRYTTAFSGTSSATPIVAGAALAVNGSRRADGEQVYDAIAMRQWLVATGTEQPFPSASIRPIGPEPDLRRALPAVAGSEEGIDANGVATGWAFHSSTPHSIGVHFYVDGPAGSGVWAGATTANVSRPDVKASFGIDSDHHGYSYNIPDAFRDDSPHVLFAYGIDPVGWKNRQLQQTLTFNLHNVKGHLDSVDDAGRVRGWAYASQQPAQGLAIVVYLDGPYPTGKFIGHVTANSSRPDVNAAFGIGGDHGFDFLLPPSVAPGELHDLVIYALDPAGKYHLPIVGQVSIPLKNPWLIFVLEPGRIWRRFP